MQKTLIEKREAYRNKAFYMMFEIGIIIALPAFLAIFLGKYIDQQQSTNKIYTLILLLISFILSWAIIIIKYVKFNKHIKNVDNQIKKLNK